MELDTRSVVSVTGSDRIHWLDSLTSHRIGPEASTQALILDPHGHIRYDLHRRRRRVHLAHRRRRNRRQPRHLPELDAVRWRTWRSRTSVPPTTLCGCRGARSTTAADVADSAGVRRVGIDPVRRTERLATGAKYVSADPFA